MGRPLKVLDPELINSLASIQCTMVEIASVMKCSVDTLERRFAEIIRIGKEEGKSSLRRAQYQLAMKGNASMLIWLGRQYLGQKDDDVKEIAECAADRILDAINRREDGRARNLHGTIVQFSEKPVI